MDGQHKGLAQLGGKPRKGCLDIDIFAQPPQTAIGKDWDFFAITLAKEPEPVLFADVIQPSVTRQGIEKGGELGARLVFGSIVP